MAWIADLVVIAVMALCIFGGYKRGLAGCIINVVSFAIAIVVSFMLFKPVSMFIVSNTELDENIKQSIVQVFEKDESPSDSVEADYGDMDKEKKGTKTGYSEQDKQSPIIKYISDEVENATAEKKKEIVNNTADKISINIINVIAFIGVFIAVRIALMFVKALADLITKIPLIKQCDKLGGILYGVLHGLVILFIGFAIATFMATITGNYGLLNVINSSIIASYLCNNNLLVNLIF